MKKIYVILSLKHSTPKEACFWRSDNAGYTTNPWGAGFYSEEQVKNDPGYYNDGCNTIAICINNSSVPHSGLALHVNSKGAGDYRKQNLGEL